VGPLDRLQKGNRQAAEWWEQQAGIGDEMRDVSRYLPTPYGANAGEVLFGDERRGIEDVTRGTISDVVGFTAEETAENTTRFAADVAEAGSRGIASGFTSGAADSAKSSPIGLLVLGAAAILGIVLLVASSTASLPVGG
jgi:hypothetical protein